MSFSNVYRGIIILSFLLILGTVFFIEVEKLSIIDAFYFSGSTLTTLGYGDIVPQTNLGKIFVVFYTIAGLGTILFISSEIFNRVANTKMFSLRKRK